MLIDVEVLEATDARNAELTGAFAAGTHTRIMGRLRAESDGNGKWTVSVPPSFSLRPSGVSYRVTEHLRGGDQGTTFHRSAVQRPVHVGRRRGIALNHGR